MAVTLLVTTHDLQPVGELRGWSDLDATVKRNTAGTGAVSVPGHPAVLDLLAAGRRLVVVRRTALGLPARVFCAGPLEGEPGELERAAAPGERTAGPGRVTVRFTTDDCHVVERITWPDPTRAWSAQTTNATWSMTAAAGAVAHALVDANCGPGALAARRAAGLVMGAGASLGPSVTLTSRFQPLGDELRKLFTVGGLSWRVRQHDTLPQLLFDVIEPTDRTATVRFGFGLNNLRSARYESSSPSCTAALVAGQGVGTARTMRERVDTAAEARWHRRIERFIDQRQTPSTAELDQAGDKELTDGAERAALSTVTRDTARCRFGEHFGLNDRVSVEIAAGLVVPDVVDSAQLTAKAPDGERVTVGFASAPTDTDPDWLIEMRAVWRRLANLEGI